MRGFILAALIAVIAYGCGRTGPIDEIDGRADGIDGVAVDEVEEAEVGCGDCDDGDPCTVDTCDARTGLCEHALIDADGDGHAAGYAPDGTVCPGDDCDDARDDVYPGASEVCLDGVDQDCDGFVDTLAVLTPVIEVSGEHRASRWNPRIAWTGSMFGIAWTQQEIGQDDSRSIRIVRLTSTGEIIGETALVAESGLPIEASIAWSGSEFGLAWVDTDLEISFARISATGTMAGSEIPLTEPESETGVGLHLVWAGSAYALAYTDRRDEYEDIYHFSNTEVRYRLLSPLGDTLGEDVRLTYSTDYATNPALSWTGTEIGIAWHDQRPGGVHSYVDTIHFRRLAPDGSAVSDELSHEDAWAYRVSPSLAWTGSAYGLLWDDRMALLPPDARDISPGPILPSDHEILSFGPAGLAWTGSEFAVAASDRYLPEPLGTSLLLVPADGSLATEALEISHVPGEDVSPVWTGSTLGIAWRAGDPDDPMNTRILFRLAGFCE
jgi:hypothetical protein